MGRATALAYAEAGVRGLVLADINATTAASTAKEAEDVASKEQFEALVVQCDMTKEDSVKAMIQTAVQKFGRVDYCANVAGVSLFIGDFDPVLIFAVLRSRKEKLCGHAC